MRRAARLRGGGDGRVDEDLYSRQLYVMGHAAQRSLARSTILLIGLTGLGAEIAKNVVLAGVSALDVCDDTPTATMDLASSWLLRDADVGQPRGLHAAERLSPLNPHVRVGTVPAPLGSESLSAYSVVVAVDQPVREQLRLNEAARAAGCKMVCASSRGAFGGVFCDFGPSFHVDDVDGEPAHQARLSHRAVITSHPRANHTPPCRRARQALLEHVGVGEDAEVTCVDEQPHGLQDGDPRDIAEI